MNEDRRDAQQGTQLLDEDTRLLDLDHALGRGRSDLFDTFYRSPRKIEERFGVSRALAFEHHRPALVPGLPDLGVKLDTTKKIDSKLTSRFLSTSPREDIDFVLAMRAHEVAHIFDNAGDINFHLAEHFDRLAGVLQRNVRWGGNHDSGSQRHGLDQRQSHIAGSGRKINDEIVEPSPFNL